MHSEQVVQVSLLLCTRHSFALGVWWRLVDLSKARYVAAL